MAGVKMNKNKTPNTGDFVNLHNPKIGKIVEYQRKWNFCAKRRYAGADFVIFVTLHLRGKCVKLKQRDTIPVSFLPPKSGKTPQCTVYVRGETLKT